MTDKKIVTINGKSYDATTGMPVLRSGLQNTKRPTIHSLSHRAKSIQNNTKRTISAIKPGLKKIGRNMDIAKSNSVSRFTNQKSSVNNATGSKPETSDIQPRKHPLVKKIRNKQAKPVEQVKKTSKEIKEEAITNALSKSSIVNKQKSKRVKGRFKYVNVFTVSIFTLFIIGYITYINIPSLSVRLASAQAGISATYPDYKPDGYSTDGPVTYSDNEVIIRFKANTGLSNFMIKQSKSTWDSSAVRNKVNKDSDGEFLTHEKNGQTIFTYGNNAAWVNGGIMYSITGSTRLSTEQVIRIATSL